MKRLALAATGLIFLSTLASCTRSSSPIATTLQDASTTNTPVVLGLGIDTDTMQVKDECSTGDVRDTGGYANDVFFERVETMEKAYQAVGFKSSASFSYALATADVTATFASSMANTKLQSTYLLTANIVNGTRLFTNQKLKPGIATDNLAAFRQRCGNSYVQASKSGGKLMAAMTFIFADEQTKQSFGGSFGISARTAVAGGSLRTSFDHTSANDRKNITIKLDFHQQGGTPEGAKKAFAGGGGLLRNCTGDNTDPCTHLMTQLFDYATGDFQTEVAKSALITDYDTKEYTGLTFPVLPAAVQQAKDDSGAALQQLLSDKSSADEVLASASSYGTIDNQKKVLAIRGQIIKNIDLVQKNIINCVNSSAAAAAQLTDAASTPAPVSGDQQHPCWSFADLSGQGFQARSYTDSDIAPVSTADTATIGGEGGTDSAAVSCTAFALGFHGSFSSFLNNLGVTCAGGDHKPLVASGWQGPTNFDVVCDSGQVMVGVRGSRGGPLIGALSILCASSKALADQTQPPPAVTEKVIFGDVSGQSLTCPAHQAVQTVNLRYGSNIDRLGLHCVSVN